MSSPLKPRGLNDPVTGAELANLVELLTKEAAAVRRAAEVLANRLPQAPGERPRYQHHESPWDQKPIGLVRNLRSAIAACDEALADFRWVRSRFDAWANDAYLSSDVREWVEGGSETED